MLPNMPFVVVRPTHAVSELPGVFNQALDMIEMALTSADFADLFFDLCSAFAVALQLQWTEADARDQWTTWTTAHPVPAEWLTITIDGDALRDIFGWYDVDTRRITLDTSTLIDRPATDQDYENKAAFLLFVKGLHEVAHSLTELILRFLKYVYRNEPYRKRRRIPTKNTPTMIGRLSANKGDCGYQLEQLLSNNMRFSYRRTQYLTYIDELTLVSKTGGYGYYIPDHLILAVVAWPARFYTLCKSFLRNHTALRPIPPGIFNTQVYKCATKRAVDETRGRRIKF
jgi:hypothetical protein